jgi:type III secretion protein R
VSETAVVVVALSLLPFVLMVSTSFAKLAVVLAMLRNALGISGVPEGAVIGVFAALLSAYVMLPVGRDMLRETAPLAASVNWSAPLSSGDGWKKVAELATRAASPLRAFLERNSSASERALFLGIARRGLPANERESVQERDLLVVLPAFFVTELAEAFQIGFLLLLPFLVLDIVIATILTSLGMQALTPSTVALPFKLLLFLSVDGFRTLIDALVAGYV